MTPAELLATASVKGNTGLQIPPAQTAAVNTFNTTGISGQIQALLTANPNDADLKAAVAAIPPFLSGNDADGNNVVAAVHEQATGLMNDSPEGTARFLGIVSAANGYAETAFNLHGAVAQCQMTNFSDYGFTVENHTDLITGGITNQFDATHLPALANDLSNLGTMYNASKLDSMFDPASVCQHLVDQGLGESSNLGAQLADAKATWVDNPEQLNNTLKNIMGGITGPDLTSILTVTNFSPSASGSITSLADVLHIDNVIGPAGQLALGDNPSLSALSNKLDNIGGSFASTVDTANMFKSIDLTSSPLLNGLSGVLPDSIANSFTSTLGTGNGVFGNPMVGDILGSAGGAYAPKIQSMLNFQSQVAATAEGSSLAQALSAVPYDPAAIASATNSLISSSSAGLQSLISGGNSDHAAAAAQLLLEKANLLKAGIDISKLTGLLDNSLLNSAMSATAAAQKIWALITPLHVGYHLSLLNIAGTLKGLAVDKMGLGGGALINKMLTADLGGAAIKACMQEGANLEALAKNGIQTFAKADPLQYAIKGVKSIRG